MIERGRREQSRLRVRLACRLITRAGDNALALVDLSRTGARVQTGAIAPPQGDAVLQWSGMEAFGTVVWARGGFCGLQFEEPIPANWLAVSRQSNETACLPDDHSRARELAQAWAAGTRRL